MKTLQALFLRLWLEEGKREQLGTKNAADRAHYDQENNRYIAVFDKNNGSG